MSTLILDKLWNGELNPGGRRISGLSQYSGKVERAEDELLAILPPEGRARFEAYDNAWVTLAAAQERDAFITGFQTAGMLLLDILRGCQDN